MRVPGLEFRPRMAGRTMWGVTALATADQSVADPLVGTLRHTAAYMSMQWGGVLLGSANRPGTMGQDTEATVRAKTFFSSETVLATHA